MRSQIVFKNALQVILGNTFLASIFFIVANCSQALPIVESRTGEPVVSNRTSYSHAPAPAPHAPAPSAPITVQSRQIVGPRAEEQRAGRLTLSQMEALQKEVSELRGLLEVQEHEIKQLRKTQQELYADLDRRINEASTKNVAQAMASKSSADLKKNQTAKGSAGSSGSPTAASSHAGRKSETNTVPAGPVTLENSSLMANVGVISSKTTSPTSSKQASSSPATATATGSTTTKQVQSTNPSPNSNAKLTDNEAYQKANNFMRNKQYSEAIQAFQDYLIRFPAGEQRGNAHYWLGEIYMVQWQGDKSNPELLEMANNEFLNVTTDFPSHVKIADAFLKLGLIELDRGNTEAARQYFIDVKSQYPGTAAARIAVKKLESIPGL